MILIYVTNPSKQEAEKVINHLIDKKLIACGNIFPITSCYLWKGEKENSNEFVCLLKTKNENWENCCKGNSKDSFL
ncbi:MAG: divalent cation tolerance protein CutA [archaeon]